MPRFTRSLAVGLAVLVMVLPGQALAAISFVGSCEAPADATPNGASVTLTLPTMQQDDLVIIAYSAGDNDNVDENMSMTTAGYTEVEDLFANDTQDLDLGVYWKVMGASPDTTAVATGVGGTDAAIAAVCMVFRGVDTTTPMDVTPVGGATTNTMNANPGAINHNNPAGVWAVAVGASGYATASGRTYTFPTGYTTDAIDNESVDTSFTSVGIGYRSSGVSDPEDPGTMTLSGSDSTSFAAATTTIALRPAVVITAPTVTTDSAVSTQPTTARLFGSITNIGGATPTTRGFAISTTAGLTTSVSTTSESGSFSTGAFNSSTTTLAADTTYFYRAYADNGSKGYGAIKSFTTGNSTPQRLMRLFEGFILRLFSGKIKLIGS